MKRSLIMLIAVWSWATYAQTTDSTSRDSVAAATQQQLLKLQAISITAPKPIYSMTGEVVNYNVENDETVRGLTAWDAIRNAPTVQVSDEGDVSMRGSEKVEVWLNGHRTGMNGAALKAFFESMPAEALARVEVVKNPSAEYMVEEGSHIINIVTSARLRSSRLLILGLSGNTRPYYSPWVSYVHNDDRLKLSFHLAGSRSRAISDVRGSDTLYQNEAIASLLNRDQHADGARLYGNSNLDISYQLDSNIELAFMSWNMLSTDYNDYSCANYERFDWLPERSYYRYCDTNSSSSWRLNGFTNFDLKRRLGKRGHNLTLGGTWNYLFTADCSHAQRLLLSGAELPLGLMPYDRTKDAHTRRNTVDLALSYNRPLGKSDALSLRLGGRPYGNIHNDRAFCYFDSLTETYSLADSLRNMVANSYSHRLYLSGSWRHEWQRTTLTLGLTLSRHWLHIANEGYFPDDTLFRFFQAEPSIGLTHRTRRMHYLRFNYSLAVANPSASELSTSRYYADDSYSVGNRLLRPSLTHRSSFSWNRYFEKIGNLGIEAYANLTTDGIESLTATTPDIDPFLQRIAYFSMPFNVGHSYKYGFDANFTYRPAAWASLSLDGSLYQQGYEASGQRHELLSWNLDARLWTKIARLVNLDASLSYGSPTLGIYSTRRTALTLGLGLSATLCQGRLILRANISDLLNTNLNQEWVSAPTYASYSSRHSSLRYLTFGLSYRFGKLSLEYQARGAAAQQ